VEQAPPPSAPLVEPKGALRHHGPDTGRPGETVRIRTLARLGAGVRIGTGPSITVAATASAQVPRPGGVLTLAPGQVSDRLGPLPAQALHGIGPHHGSTLSEYGVHTTGLLAAVPPATAQRLLGGGTGRIAATGPAASTPAPSPSAPCPEAAMPWRRVRRGPTRPAPAGFGEPCARGVRRGGRARPGIRGGAPPVRPARAARPRRAGWRPALKLPLDCGHLETGTCEPGEAVPGGKQVHEGERADPYGARFPRVAEVQALASCRGVLGRAEAVEESGPSGGYEG
jgi:hypothetical protein